MMSAGVAHAQQNPCPYTNDGDCDEPNGLGYCDWGTDTADCSNPNSNYGNGSGYAGSGGSGTGSGGGGGLQNPCPYTNDGDCDEPNGLGYCAWGTDTADCSNPNSNYGNGSGYAGGGVTPPPQTPPTPPQPMPPHAASFAGIWASRVAGDMTLYQTGNQVSGTYTCCSGGQLTGIVTGGVLTGTYIEDNGTDYGTVRFDLSQDGRSFTGTWSRTSGGQASGSWDGTRR